MNADICGRIRLIQIVSATPLGLLECCFAVWSFAWLKRRGVRSHPKAQGCRLVKCVLQSFRHKGALVLCLCAYSGSRSHTLAGRVSLRRGRGQTPGRCHQLHAFLLRCRERCFVSSFTTRNCGTHASLKLRPRFPPQTTARARKRIQFGLDAKEVVLSWLLFSIHVISQSARNGQASLMVLII